MKYPYIGRLKDKENGVVLFCDKDEGAQLNSSGKGWHDEDVYKYTDDWDELKFKNITAEYLANTYGEVKSKEHAEFIVKLADNNKGMKVCRDYVFNNVSAGCFFSFGSTGELSFWIDKYTAAGASRKKITIPLPPECDGVDEWPKVGSSVEWGHTGKGEVKYLSDGFAWIKLDNKDYTTVYVSSLRKPKTPEQELEYNLTDLIMRARDADVDDVTIARSILSKYNITKKGEGDE